MLQGLKHCIALWDQEGFARMLARYQADLRRNIGTESAAHCIPDQILNALEGVTIDFLSRTGQFFQEIVVPGFHFPWALDMAWKNNLLGEPVLCIKVWDYPPLLEERLAQ